MAVIPSQHQLNLAPFTKKNLYSLGYKENWPELRRILHEMAAPSFGVLDACSQALVDDARLHFDSCVGGSSKGNVLYRVLSGGESCSDIVELLLSIGVHPDLENGKGFRPSQSSAVWGLAKASRAILLCRPDMKAKDRNGCTPLGAAVRTYRGDQKFPERLPGRQDVANFIRSERLEHSYKTLAELASRKIWFAVKNLVRRQVIPASEFAGKVFGKTAAEWAEHFGEKQMVDELRYYGSLPSAELLVTKDVVRSLEDKIEELSEELAIERGRIDVLNVLSAEKDAALAKVEAEASKHKKQVAFLEERCSAYEKKVGELSETIAALTSRTLPGENSELVDQPGANRPKLEANGPQFGGGADDE